MNPFSTQVSHRNPPPLRCHIEFLPPLRSHIESFLLSGLTQNPSSSQVSHRTPPLRCHTEPSSTQVSHRVLPPLRCHKEPLLCSESQRPCSTWMSYRVLPPRGCHIEPLLHAGVPQDPSFLQVSHLDPPLLGCHTDPLFHSGVTPRPSSTQGRRGPFFPSCVTQLPFPLRWLTESLLNPGVTLSLFSAHVSHGVLLLSCVTSCSHVAPESVPLFIITQSPSLTYWSLPVPLPPTCFTEPSHCGVTWPCPIFEPH